MKTTLIALLALVVLAPFSTIPAQAGIEAYASQRPHHRRAEPRRPRIIRSSSRYPGGRCGQLNLERARLYGLCR